MAKFQGRKPGLKYQPRWTAEPLRYIVESALRRHQASRSSLKRITDFLSGDGHHLRVAIDKLVDQDLGPSIVLEGR